MKNAYKLVFLLLVFITSCSDETTYFSQQEVGNDLVLEKSTSVLSNGINKSSNGVLGIYFEHNITAKSAVLSSKAASDFHLNLGGQVTSPSFEASSNLTATHVDYKDQFAYVSYNTIGETFAGAVDVIDLSNPEAPILTSRMYMYNRDANVLLYDDGYVYVLGSVNMDQVVEATANSFIAKIAVQNGILDVDNVSYFYQQGFTATGITKMQNSFYVSSGVNGSIAQYDASTFTKSNEIVFDDLRSVTSDTGKLALLDGATGVTVMDSELNVISQFSLSSNVTADSKRTIAIKEEELIVAEGSEGAGVYDLNTGQLKEYLPILTNPENIVSTDKVTNAVAVNGDVTLLANGGAGLAVKVKNEIIDLMGVVELTGSINYVVSEGDYIFAASGNSGLQIINKIRSQETIIIPEGNYIIRARHSNRVLSLDNASMDNGANIQQGSRNGTDLNERWNLELLNSGAYVIRSNSSNKAIYKTNDKFGTQPWDYHDVLQWDYLERDNSHWVIEPAIDEGYFLIRNLDNNEYLDVYGNSRQPGASVITWPYHGGQNQQWELVRQED